MINPNQIDILKYSTSNTHPLYDRPITVEVWYPAVIPQALRKQSSIPIPGPLRQSKANPTYRSRSLVAPSEMRPLHHHRAPSPGDRLTWLSRLALHDTYLDENLASKGYVVWQ